MHVYCIINGCWTTSVQLIVCYTEVEGRQPAVKCASLISRPHIIWEDDAYKLAYSLFSWWHINFQIDFHKTTEITECLILIILQADVRMIECIDTC
jgi:serine acetyltransferase